MKFDVEKVGIAVVEDAMWDRIWLEENWDRVNVMKKLEEIKYIKKVDDKWVEKIIKGK